MTIYFEFLGALLMISGGFLLVGALLTIAGIYLNSAAWDTWEKLETFYRVKTMTYWFARMKKEGVYVLREDFEEKLKQKEDNENV